jgi:hypothetical protein
LFGLLLAAGLTTPTAPVPRLAAGTYTYTATLQGKTVGTSTITVTDDGAMTDIDERASGSLQGAPSSGSATLVLGHDLEPVSYHVTGATGATTVTASASVSGDAASVTDAQGHSASFDLPASTKHFVIVDLGMFAGFMPLAAQMGAWDDVPVFALVPTFGQAVALVPAAAPAASRPPDVPAADHSVSFGGETPFTIWYDPKTYIPDRIDVTSQDVTVTRQR